MSITFIRRYIFALEKGRLFTTRECLKFGKRATVDQALCRLVRANLIVRLARGVFMRDDWEVRRPTVFEVARVKSLAFGKNIAMHGADLARDLGLAASGNSQPTFAVDKRSSSFRFGDTTVHLREASMRKMHAGDTMAGSIIRALWHIGRIGCTAETIMRASARIGRIEREELSLSVRWMPSWMGDYFIRC